jgi:hypothetical protein
VKRGLICGVLTSVFLAFAVPTSADVAVGRTVLFVGDFETGSFSQWSQCDNRRHSGVCTSERVEFYGMRVLPGSAREGQYAARFEVRNGDKPRRGGGERAEVARYGRSLVHEGDERWYEFSLKFDADFPVVDGKYVIVMQWHGGERRPPAMALSVKGDGQLVLTGTSSNDPPKVIGDIARGRWVDYVLHTRFSRTKGWAEVYRDGVKTVPLHSRVNMTSESNYLKLGIYRDHREKSTAIMWADGVRITAP